MKFLLFLVLAVTSTIAAAQNEELTYRDSDPFLFCHYGQKDPARCWWPVAPYTGGMAFMVSPACKPVNPVGKPWSNDDEVSLAQYQLICPDGKQSGEWDTKGGAADLVPYAH